MTSDAIYSRSVSSLTREGYDALPFGVIELDSEFRVCVYNSTEAQFARRSAADTLGRDFFAEVAPCTDVPGFRGRLEQLMGTGGALDDEVRFDYEFAFSWGRRRVRIRALRGEDTCWVFVTPLPHRAT